MENLGGFGSFPAIDEEVATNLLLLCAALHYFKSQLDSLEGFRFQPTNNQILHLLEKKRLDPSFSHRTVKDIDDICSVEPWDLPRESHMEPEEQVWYFFYKPYYKYKESKRTNRRTNEGFWKITGTGSNIKTRNGLTGGKKILTFHRHGPDSKKANTKFVMHEYHVDDKPSYKEEFVLCRIERKWDNKLGVSTPDEGESSQQMVSPNQILAGDHLISSGNHIDEISVTNPQPLPTHNSISYSGNHIEHNTLTNLQLPPNHNLISHYGNLIEQNSLPNQNLLPDQNMISKLGNHIEQNSLPNSQSLPTHNMVPYPGNHIVQNTISTNTQLQQNILSNLQLQLNHNLISCFGNPIDQNTIPQLVPYDNLISHRRNHIEENTLSNPPPSSNHNPISSPRNHIDEDGAFMESQLPPNSVSQVVIKHLLDKNNVVGNTLQEENHQLGEFNASGGNNRLNYASFPTPQSLNFQEMEFSYCSQLTVSSQGLSRMNSPEETGQTHTPDFNSSKLDGGTCAKDSSDANSETFDALLDKLLENNDEDNALTESQLPPNSVSQVITNHLLDKNNVVGNTLQEENHQFEEFNASGGNNRLNYAYFPTPLSPNFQEMEFSYCNSIDSEQRRAFQDELSRPTPLTLTK